MRIAGLFALILGSFLLPAQETTPKVKVVGAKPTSPASGKEMFHAYCASCHGLDGKGNGPAASALKKQPADLTLLAQQSGGKFPAMRVMNSIKDGTQAGHGSKDMPVWGPILSTVSSDSPAVVTQRIGNLIGFIESMQVK
ncbi:MAG: cytochrome c [Candidatus Sulfopaludibacter sp.]|nr:cytochrome c [Candidatus Sulfopaludibacter sp.]